ncbi:MULTISPECIES: IS66 family transposase [unclassified Tolypothrix]|uniref:IS66 family transposase n=1 Tax=unclassified Tolypothrix TaxID=2649714 RepID=UPI000B5F1536|nr:MULTISPECIES: IS66 family transposase [unclassified Tolypothrix]BAY91235.1 transposase IS66 [Microchaete diplosiphon NIES-3275]UYD25962.1 IS66 family transposase [Tolypothrix sp. PCC 7712]UYD27993.1 IS66 family transposase [Tolypothrix sp. PCC 7712]UYD30653.1 IS66 family transposase [Tolypothrix sp. PCC 7712]UYD38515.1 IS66 family transposase [Tolypothrix sp. PCC 7601]
MNQNLPQDLNRESLNQLSKQELVEIIIEQSKVIGELQKTVLELQQEIERLKVSRDLDSKTSSKPPSGDILKKSENKKAAPQEESNHPKRKPGGQPGHQGKTRKGFGRVDRCEILRPSDCVCCGQKAFAAVAVKVEKQSVAQLVERPIEIVEYQRHTCQCEYCGNIQTASWSQDIIPGQDLGISLQAFLGWANNYAHMPYEKQQEMLWELGQIEIGLGTLVTTNERIQTAIQPSITELSNWVKQTQPNIHVDETPWSVKGVKEWLWVVANSEFCLFTAADTRSRAELEAILGAKYTGVISSDDFSVYNGYAVPEQQKCLAHLRRHFKKLIQLPGLHNQAIGEAFVDLIDEAFGNYAQWFETLDCASYNDWVNQFKSKLQQTLDDWINLAGATAGNLLRSLRDKASQWWYFLDNPEVPPDNNQAERSLRLAVTKRKVSGGSRSMERFQHTANLLTVVQTCRRQSLSVIDFFVQALIADSINSQSRPSLVPQF